jgi:hypothetical protein
LPQDTHIKKSKLSILYWFYLLLLDLKNPDGKNEGKSIDCGW